MEDRVTIQISPFEFGYLQGVLYEYRDRYFRDSDLAGTVLYRILKNLDDAWQASLVEDKAFIMEAFRSSSSLRFRSGS